MAGYHNLLADAALSTIATPTTSGQVPTWDGQQWVSRTPISSSPTIYNLRNTGTQAQNTVRYLSVDGAASADIEAAGDFNAVYYVPVNGVFRMGAAGCRTSATGTGGGTAVFSVVPLTLTTSGTTGQIVTAGTPTDIVSLPITNTTNAKQYASSAAGSLSVTAGSYVAFKVTNPAASSTMSETWFVINFYPS